MSDAQLSRAVSEAARALGRMSNEAQARHPAKYKADRVKGGKLAGAARAKLTPAERSAISQRAAATRKQRKPMGK